MVSLKGEGQEDGKNSKGRQEKPHQIQPDLALRVHTISCGDIFGLKTVSKETGFSWGISSGLSDTELCLFFPNKQVSVNNNNNVTRSPVLMAQIRRAEGIQSKFSLCCRASQGLTGDRSGRALKRPIPHLKARSAGLHPLTDVTPACSPNFPC